MEYRSSGFASLQCSNPRFSLRTCLLLLYSVRYCYGATEALRLALPATLLGGSALFVRDHDAGHVDPLVDPRGHTHHREWRLDGSCEFLRGADHHCGAAASRRSNVFTRPPF
jgi:hypothetical protein